MICFRESLGGVKGYVDYIEFLLEQSAEFLVIRILGISGRSRYLQRYNLDC